MTDPFSRIVRGNRQRLQPGRRDLPRALGIVVALICGALICGALVCAVPARAAASAG